MAYGAALGQVTATLRELVGSNLSDVESLKSCWFAASLKADDFAATWRSMQYPAAIVSAPL
jgi:hypothetical protein